jgi:predicted transposase YbfD/YdcC
MDPQKPKMRDLRASLSPKGEREVIAIDGKTSRRSAIGDASPLHTVSVYSVQHGLVLTAAAVPEKTNEITVIPELLAVIAPVGAIITTDALGCQKEIARQVREVPKADDLLALKGNHPQLEQDAQWVFAYHDQQGWKGTDHSYAQTFNQGHGRREQRECWLLRDLTALEQAGEWRDLRAVVRVRATRTVGEQTSVEERLSLTSLQGEAREALHASRLHWGVENSLHWVLDVVFGDDASRVHLQNARQNWVALRHFVLALLRRDTSVKGSLRSKRYRAALDTRYLQHLLTLR